MPCHTGPPQQANIEGAGKKKGILGKEERYSDNKTKRSLYTEKRKLVLMIRMRDQWNGGTISDI
jgi:hypothetical protein